MHDPVMKYIFIQDCDLRTKDQCTLRSFKRGGVKMCDNSNIGQAWVTLSKTGFLSK